MSLVTFSYSMWPSIVSTLNNPPVQNRLESTAAVFNSCNLMVEFDSFLGPVRAPLFVTRSNNRLLHHQDSNSETMGGIWDSLVEIEWDMDPDVLLEKSGWLYKLDGKIMKSWVKRWFVLREMTGELSCFNHPRVR